MERERNEYFSLSFHILFFPFFPMAKNGKTHIFPWAKMELDPPPVTRVAVITKVTHNNYSNHPPVFMCTQYPYVLYIVLYANILLLGQCFAIKSKIKNIVFLINLKAKKVFFKVLSRFNEIFRSEKSKN